MRKTKTRIFSLALTLVTILGLLPGTALAAEAAGAVYSENSFRDVPAGSWYAQNAAWAAETGITGGYGFEESRPNRIFYLASSRDMYDRGMGIIPCYLPYSPSLAFISLQRL